jgi:uncharacterized protein (TIGR02246 family)
VRHIFPAPLTCRLAAIIVLACLFAAAPSMAQSLDGGDEAAIRKTLARYADARNRRDADAEALCYTTDGDFRSSLGPFVSGRAAIEKQLAVTNPDYHFALTVTRLRSLADGVVIVDAEVLAGVGARPGKLVGTYVMTRDRDGWLIAAARIATAPAPRQ